MSATEAVPVFSGEVHPAAEVWPLMTEDELNELAVSIAEVGLLEPIAIDLEGRLVDGRNRLAACKRAAIEPTFVTILTDPTAYVIAKNNERRHMTTGARAMAAAVVLAGAGRRKNGRWQRGSVVATSGSVSSDWAARMAEAGLVIDHCPTDAPKVVAGEMALDAAVSKAKRVKAAGESYDARRKVLEVEASDLAENVTDDATLAEAEAALAARKAEAEKRFKLHVAKAQAAAEAWGHLCLFADRKVENQAAVLEALNDRDRGLIVQAMTVIRKGRA